MTNSLLTKTIISESVAKKPTAVREAVNQIMAEKVRNIIDAIKPEFGQATLDQYAEPELSEGEDSNLDEAEKNYSNQTLNKKMMGGMLTSIQRKAKIKQKEEKSKGKNNAS